MLAVTSSPDGTSLGWHTSGAGSPLVLLHGTGSDHTTWHPLLPFLEPHATVHAMDRRGRGASGDADAYDVAREFADVAAVVDAVAADAGQPVAVLGHSFGGFCALGSIPLTGNVGRLVLYEPPVTPEGGQASPDQIAHLEALLAADRRDELLHWFLHDLVEVSEKDIAAFRATPGWWERRKALAHTIPRELVAVPGPLDLAAVAARRVPTLMVVGSESPDLSRADTERVAAELHDVTVDVLEGQEHVAHFMAPGLFAEHVLRFMS